MTTPTAQYVHEGRRIDYMPGSDIPAGEIIPLGTKYGIPVRDLKNGILGSLDVKGVFEFEKTAGGGTALAIGDRANFEPGTKKLVNAASSTSVDLGWVTAVATDADEYARVSINE